MSLFILQDLLTYHLLLIFKKDSDANIRIKINVANYCYSVEMIDAEEKNKM